MVELAQRLSQFEGSVHRLVGSGLSPQGTAIAIALLVTTSGNLFTQSAAALRALATHRAAKEQQP